MDKVSPEVRSRIMSRIRSANTKPEIKARAILDALNVKYKFQERMFGVRIDFYLPDTNTALFIDGKFWHGKVKDISKLPEFWQNKLRRNMERDIEQNKTLFNANVKVVRIWEDEVSMDEIKRRLSI